MIIFGYTVGGVALIAGLGMVFLWLRSMFRGESVSDWNLNCYAGCVGTLIGGAMIMMAYYDSISPKYPLP